jgi:hypothetical protein
MSFSMRPNPQDDAVQRYLDEERQREEQRRSGRSELGGLGSAYNDNATNPIAQPEARPELPQAAPSGFKPPAYWTPTGTYGGGPPAQAQPAPAAAPDAAGAAAPVAASGGAAAGAAASPFLAVLGQYLDQRKQQHEMKQRGRQDLQADYAASLGYPTDRLRAAQINQRAGGLEGEDMLKYLMPFGGGQHLRG